MNFQQTKDNDLAKAKTSTNDSSTDPNNRQAVPSFLFNFKSNGANNAEEEKKQESNGNEARQNNKLKVDEIIREYQLAEKLEALTKNTLFQQLSEINNLDSYVLFWLDYQMLVRDSDKVIKYMFDHGIGIREPKVHVTLAHFYEKYKRDFKAAEIVYQKALQQNDGEKFAEFILRKYEEFSGRMQARIVRDIVEQIGQDIFDEKIRNKKRKLGEAFPELNLSNNSDQSNASKKRKINNSIKQYSENVKHYEDGISYLKQNIPYYKELPIHEQTQRELDSKPYSWISKESFKILNITQELGYSDTSSQKDNSDIISKVSDLNIQEHQNKSSINGDLNQNQLKEPQIQKQQQEANIKAKILESIGETSLELHSNVSAFYNQQSRKSQSRDESKLSLNDTNIFKTANNSIDSIQKDQNSLQNEDNKKHQLSDSEQIMQQVNGIFQNLKSLSNLSQDDASKISQQVLNLFQQKGLVDFKQVQQNRQLENGLEQKQNTNQLNQQRSNFHMQIPKNSMNQNQISVSPLVQPKDSQKDVEKLEEKKRLSGIFMQLFEEGEKKRQSDVNIQTPVQDQKPSIFQSFFNNFKITGNRQPLQQISYQENESQSNNASYLDATPIESQNFRKHLNPNYSQDLFIKKRTLSKVKDGFLNVKDEDEKQEQIMSPFGIISPMNYKTRMRGSDIMKDCYGDSLDLVTKNQEVNYNPFKYQQNQYQQQSYSYIPQFKEGNNIQVGQNQNSNAYSVFESNLKPSGHQNNDSLDSIGQRFQDCNEDMNFSNGYSHGTMRAQSSNMNLKQSDFSKLPSALKANSNLNGNSVDDPNSRNGSKSVRFQNY